MNNEFYFFLLTINIFMIAYHGFCLLEEPNKMCLIALIKYES